MSGLGALSVDSAGLEQTGNSSDDQGSDNDGQREPDGDLGSPLDGLAIIDERQVVGMQSLQYQLDPDEAEDG